MNLQTVTTYEQYYLQQNQLQHPNSMYHPQDVSSNNLQTSTDLTHQQHRPSQHQHQPHQQQQVQQPAVDLRYLELSEQLPLEDEQLGNLGNLMPLNLHECEVESCELDRYLPQQSNQQMNQQQQFNTQSDNWQLNR